MPSIIKESDLVKYRKLHDRLAMPDSCDVIRAPEVQTSGGSSRNWTNPTVVATAVPCRYSEDLTRQDIEEAGRLDVVATAKLVLPALLDINAYDRVRNVTVEGVNLGTFEVAAVQRKSWEIFRKSFVRQA